MIPLLIRGGHIVPTQLPGLTTYDTWSNPYHLYVALNQMGGAGVATTASGSVSIDDGVTLGNLDTTPVPNFYRILFTANFPPPPPKSQSESGSDKASAASDKPTASASDMTAGVIEITMQQSATSPDISHLRVDNITIYGLPNTALYDCSKVTINTVVIDPYTNPAQRCYWYMPWAGGSGVLVLEGLGLILENGNSIVVPLMVSPTPPAPPSPSDPLTHRPLFIWTLVACLVAVVGVVGGIVCFRRNYCMRWFGWKCCESSAYRNESIGLLVAQQQAAAAAAAHTTAGDL